jgi:signal transduction histidine kinase
LDVLEYVELMLGLCGQVAVVFHTPLGFMPLQPLAAKLVDPFVALAIIGGVLGALLAEVTWQQRPASGAYTYAVLMSVLALWSLLYAGQLLSVDLYVKSLWIHIRHATIPLIAVLFWIFVAKYTNRKRLLNIRYLGPVLSVGVLLGTTSVLNPGDLYFSGLQLYTESALPRAEVSYGPLFWAMVIYIFATIGGGHLYLTKLWNGVFDMSRPQLSAFVVSGVMEFGLLFWYLTEHVELLPSLNPWPFVELPVYGVTLLGVPLGWSYLNNAYFSLQPLAQRNVIENLSDAVYVFDTHDQAVYVNSAGEQLLSKSAPDPGTVPTVESLFVDRPVFLDYYRNERGETSQLDTSNDEEDPQSPAIVNIDDRIGYYELDSTNLRNPVGERLGRVLVAQDVTELHEQQLQLQERTAQLEQQNEQLDMFAAAVSHDLQNQLHSVRGYLQLAREGETDEYYQKAQTSLDETTEMVDSLLTLARAKTNVEKDESVAISSVARAVWQATQTTGATLNLKVPQNVRVSADRELLRVLFDNLIHNALEHNDRPLTVTVGFVDGNESHIGWYIADDGSGLPFEEETAVFDRGTTTASDERGLGLSIVKQVVNAHGWEIRVAQKQDSGARFEIVDVELQCRGE